MISFGLGVGYWLGHSSRLVADHIMDPDPSYSGRCSIPMALTVERGATCIFCVVAAAAVVLRDR